MSYSMEYPLDHLGQLSLLCPLPTSCAPSASLLVGPSEMQNIPWHCVRTAQQKWKQEWVINTITGFSAQIQNITQVSTKKFNYPSQNQYTKQESSSVSPFACLLEKSEKMNFLYGNMVNTYKKLS